MGVVFLNVYFLLSFVYMIVICSWNIEP